MPELPEVETIRRQLAPVLEGLRISGAEVFDAKWAVGIAPDELEGRLSGRAITEFGRRGKYFVAMLDDTSALVMHLRMTGNLLYTPEGEVLPERHARARLWLETPGGSTRGALSFTDPRRFGTAELLGGEGAVERYFAQRLGPEPFDEAFDAAYLKAQLRTRRTPVKAVLLDQAVVAGVGNIYADEALFRAGVAPQKRAARATRAEAARLVDAVREALTAGIDAKGASIDDFRDAYGVQGSFQDQFLVHRREGLPCPSCGRAIEKIRCAGRGTYLCRSCQTG